MVEEGANEPLNADWSKTCQMAVIFISGKRCIDLLGLTQFHKNFVHYNFKFKFYAHLPIV